MLKMFLGLLLSFFLQSRSVVLDSGHTPGQHAQCQNTPNTRTQLFIFSGFMAAGPPARMHAGVHGPTLAFLSVTRIGTMASVAVLL